MTTIADKADHVRAVIASGETRGHGCHWPGCEAQCAPAAWGCRRHWYMVPRRLRNKIWAAYRPAQEISKTPSRRYVEAANEVQAWIRNYLANGGTP